MSANVLKNPLEFVKKVKRGQVSYSRFIRLIFLARLKFPSSNTFNLAIVVGMLSVLFKLNADAMSLNFLLLMS